MRSAELPRSLVTVALAAVVAVGCSDSTGGKRSESGLKFAHSQQTGLSCRRPKVYSTEVAHSSQLTVHRSHPTAHLVQITITPHRCEAGRLNWGGICAPPVYTST